MNQRQLAILAVIALVSVGTTAVVLRSGTQTIASDRRGERIFPALAAKANEITGLTVRQGADTLAVERRDAGFVLADSAFPVKADPVRELVASAIELTFEEARTSDPTRYGELGLADPGAKDGGKEVVLRTASGELAAFVIGNRDATVGGPVGGVFVRLKGQPQTWLARGNVRLPTGRSDWFAPVELGVKRGEVKAIALSGGGLEGVSVVADAEKPGGLTLQNVPEKRVADTYKVTRLASLLETFSVQDVRKRSKAADDARRMVVEVADGLRLVVTGVGELSEGWVQISAEATNDSKRERADAITAKVGGFDFRLPAGQVEPLGWTNTDMTNEQPS